MKIHNSKNQEPINQGVEHFCIPTTKYPMRCVDMNAGDVKKRTDSFSKPPTESQDLRSSSAEKLQKLKEDLESLRRKRNQLFDKKTAFDQSLPSTKNKDLDFDELDDSGWGEIGPIIEELVALDAKIDLLEQKIQRIKCNKEN